MGTSKGYQAPTTPQWSKLKGDVTRYSKDGAALPTIARDIIRDFIKVSSGTPNAGGGGGTRKGSNAAIATGKKLAGFARSVATGGLGKALEEIGLGELVGKSAGEITLALLDKLCDEGSTLDEVDVRNALSDLTDELLEEAKSYDEVVLKLEEKFTLEILEQLLFTFFNYYLYHQFCRVFYERLVAKHGESKTENFLKSIRDFIASELKYQTFEKNLAHVDWSGEEGEHISNEVLQRTLLVFGGQ